MSTRFSEDRETNGHGAERHGRLTCENLYRAQPALFAAMNRLLALAQIQPKHRVDFVFDKPLHALELGEGKPLLLIHGASGGGANWYRLMADLARHARVFAPDLPGFGFSQAIEPHAPLGRHISALLLEWLDRIGVAQFNVVGTSFGGLVALRLAQLAGERVDKVAIIDSAGLGPGVPLTLRMACMPGLVNLALRPSRRGTAWQLQRLMTTDRSQLPPAHTDALIEFLYQSALASDARLLARAFTMFSGFAGQREILSEAELRNFPNELLILWGECDRFLPPLHGRQAAALVPRAHFRIIPAAGHSPNWEAPDRVLAFLQPFLAGALHNPNT